MKSQEKIEVNEYKMFASNGNPIGTATRITIDGHAIDFTVKLTDDQIKRYFESREAQKRQAESHAMFESLGG